MITTRNDLPSLAGGVYVYGAGAFGRALAGSLRAANIDVLAMFDSRLPEAPKDEIPVLRLREGGADTSIPLLNSVMGYAELEGELQHFGFRQVVPTEVVMTHFPEALRSFASDGHNWRQMDSDLRVDVKAIQNLRSQLADDKSKRLLDTLVAFRLDPRIENYPWPDRRRWYFPQDVPMYRHKRRLNIVDCGAFDGDTLRSFLEVFPTRIGHYLAVEPDIQTSKLLVEWVETNVEQRSAESPTVRIVNSVVSDHFGFVLFEGSGSAGRVIDAHSGESSDMSKRMKCTTIDDLRGDVDWNILKMDIEGSELAALRGARSLIEDLRPELAISVYHRPDDLWRVPEYVNEVSRGGYSLYLRQEGHFGEETVLYGVPSEA